MSGLFARCVGHGPESCCCNGSVFVGEFTWREQLPLAERFTLVIVDRRCAERAQDLREVFAGTDGSDVQATSRQAQIAAEHAVDAMTGDPEWRALYLEFLAHAARDVALRRGFARRTDEMRGAVEDVVVDRTRPVGDALGRPPEQLAVVIDALGVGLWAQHMLHGSRAVPQDLFSNALA